MREHASLEPLCRVKHQMHSWFVEVELLNSGHMRKLQAFDSLPYDPFL